MPLSATYKKTITVSNPGIDENRRVDNVTYVHWIQDVAAADEFKMNSRRLFHPIKALILLIALQLACQSFNPSSPTPDIVPTETQTSLTAVVTPTSEPTESPPFSKEEIMTGIQKSLDLFAQAYTDNNPDLLEQVVDQENKPFRRIVRSRFDDFQTSYEAGQIQFHYDLIDIEPREPGYIVARFHSQSGNEASWLFKYTGDRWVITEPTVEQIGKPVITETDHFIFTTYPWSDNVNPQIMDMMEIARENVRAVLGKVPDEKSNVSILPIYGLRPFNPMIAIALYNGNGIEVYAPDTFAFAFYDPSRGWDGELQRTLTHEFTHLVHAQSFNQAGRLADWMSEGLAEYVAGAKENIYWACDAAKSGTTIPILDESGAVYKQDLMHMYLLEEDFVLSYGYATSLVFFTVENYGGMDGFWKLANALDRTGDFKKAVHDAYGISYEDYNTNWQAWLKKQC